MSRRISFAVLAAGLAVGLASPALAQDQAPPPRPPATAKPPAARAAKQPVFRAYGQFDFTAMTASKSFDAVLGSSTLTGFGAGGELIKLWKGAFARLSFSSASASGSRVIVVGSEVVPLNVPVDVGITALTLGGGWRFQVNRRIVAYGGAGFVLLGYTEDSEFAGNEDSDESFNGSAVFGGVEIPLGSWFIVGGEVEWRTVPDALGEFASVSKAFGETNLGGTTVRVLFGIRK
jgi:opacity protein-like surface antigen